MDEGLLFGCSEPFESILLALKASMILESIVISGDVIYAISAPLLNGNRVDD